MIVRVELGNATGAVTMNQRMVIGEVYAKGWIYSADFIPEDEGLTLADWHDSQTLFVEFEIMGSAVETVTMPVSTSLMAVAPFDRAHSKGQWEYRLHMRSDIVTKSLRVRVMDASGAVWTPPTGKQATLYIILEVKEIR